MEILSHTCRKELAGARCGEVVECASDLLWMDIMIDRNASGYVSKGIMFNESVAVKAYNEGWVKAYKSDASVMAKLNHPGIVPLVGVISHPDDGRSCLIMELMSGDLEFLINSRPRFSLHVSVDIILQIAEAMQHIHNAGLVHRKLYPHNNLFKVMEDKQLSSAGFVVVKVADFGAATESKEGELSKNLGRAGPTVYMPPKTYFPNLETVRMRNSNVVDVYSFGIVCYEILSGRRPYDDWASSLEDLKMRVRNGERPILPATCPPILDSLTKRCWASDPNSRPDFEKICLELRHIKTMVITGSSSSINFQ